ncbi:MAG: PASTA domain-containing protein [Candidatus Aminicenantes bacterium]|nr:PASTA domain-containing protein [Candidatus Aminicenantes bacterium]
MGKNKNYWFLEVINFILLILIFFFGGAVISSQIILNDEMVNVPDIVGKTIDQARSELQKRDLSLSISGSQFSDEVERGRILVQDPAPGSRIKVNRTISVTISNGRESATVPNFVGKSLEQSINNLRQVGLVKGPLSQIHTPQYPAGKVIAQNPPPQTVVERSTPVGFLVSQGEAEPKYIMPDLIGRKINQAVPRLQELGFKVEDIRYVYYPGLEKGIIVKQNPPGGYPIQKRNPISLEVSR